MSVVIAYEEAGPWRKKLTIEVPAPAVEAETGRVVKEIGRAVRLPGFRPGKVPVHMIKRRFPEEVEHRVAERLVPRYWKQAEAEKNLDPLTQPQIDDLVYEDGAPMTFVALVETRPDIELGDVEHFDLPQGNVEPSDDEVTEALRELRHQHADWHPVERPAAAGDRVVGKVTEVHDSDGGDVDVADSPKPLRFEIGAQGADEEVSMALTGLAAGGSTTVKRRLGDGEDVEEKELLIEVTAVEEAKLPDLDDAFAEQIGLESVDELRTAVRERMEASRRDEMNQRRERALLEQLRQRHPLELPRGVVDQQVESMMRDYAANLSAQGVDLESTPVNWETAAEQARPMAEQRVHDRLILDAVAEARGVKVDEEEFERVLATIARQHKKSSLAVRQEFSSDGRLQELRAQLRRSRTVRQLLGEESTDDEDLSADTATEMDPNQDR